jgi:hypothetical protein
MNSATEVPFHPIETQEVIQKLKEGQASTLHTLGSAEEAMMFFETRYLRK